MSTAEDNLTSYEIIDHEILQSSGLVTYVVDIWDGDRHDPAVSITRYLAVYLGEKLETEDGEAFDPNFGYASDSRYGGSSLNKDRAGEPKIWAQIETIKKADREAENALDDYKRMTGKSNRYSYGSTYTTGAQTMYNAFLDAIDRLGTPEETETDWEAVEKWRTYQAHKEEK
jgi:hypothetical protein